MASKSGNSIGIAGYFLISKIWEIPSTWQRQVFKFEILIDVDRYQTWNGNLASYEEICCWDSQIKKFLVKN